MMKTENDLKYGIQPFWFWNGWMDEDEIIRQIREMKAQGIKGFIIHPRQGMEIPYLSNAYFDRVRLAVAEAKRLEMEVWLYDEYPYPSGVTAGQVPLDHPEYLCKMLDKREYLAKDGETVVMDLPWGQVLTAKAYPVTDGATDWEAGIELEGFIGTAYEEEVFQFSGLTAYNHKRYFTGKQAKRLWWTAPEGTWQVYVFMEVVMTGFKYFDTYVDTMNPAAVRHYLETTHERYAKELGGEFGTTVKGIFTDEITAFPPERPWSPLLPQKILEKTGIRILDYLPALFDIPMGDMTDRVLYAYWNTCTDAFIESYDKQVYEWCEEKKIRFIGEKPILRSKELAFTHCPGIDAGHQKAGDKPVITPGKYRANGKIVSSAEHFYGRDAALCEAFHSIGWGMTIQDMKWIFDWLAVHGIDWFVVHGFFYTTNGLKKHDAPPSAFYQMPWWKNMHLLSEYTDRLLKTARSCKRRVPLLLVDPVTSAWTAKEKEKEGVRAEFGRLQQELLKNRLDYYIIDPQLLAEGRVRKDEDDVSLVINEEAYRYVVLPSITNLEDPCFYKIREFAEAGGITGAVGRLADRRIMEAEPGEWMKRWFLQKRKNADYGETPEELCEKLCARTGVYRLEAADGLPMDDILSVEYEKKDGNLLYFLVNVSGRKRVIKGSILKRELVLGPLESGFYETDEHGYLVVPEKNGPVYDISLNRNWKLELEGENALRLGYWNMEAERTGQASSAPVETMPVIDQLEKGKMLIPLQPRKQFGCPKKLLLPEDRYCYQARFEILDDAVLLNPVHLVMEPWAVRGEWSICINGRELSESDFIQKEFYLPDNRAAEVTESLRTGKNEISVTVSAKKTFDGVTAPLYLMGRFGVEADGSGWRLTKEPETGCMVDAGKDKIPYYAGTAEYSCELELPQETKAATPSESPVRFIISDAWLQDCAELLVNGVSAGIKAWAPYQWEVPPEALKTGTNHISLKLTNTMAGLFEGQHFDRELRRYVNYQGEETEIEEYEAVVHK